MDLTTLTRFRLRRVNPYRGLVIDETTWAEAHDYHRDHIRLHALAFHSEGIVAGLEVTPGKEAGTLQVGPGIALDAEGNTLVVGQERKVEFEGIEPGAVYVLLSYQENKVNADASAPRGAQPNRIVESYKLEAGSKPPEAGQVEVARLRWTGAAVKQASDASNPREDEIDLRFRLQATSARPRTVRVGIVPRDSDPMHLRGAMNLVREIDGIAGYRGSFAGPLDLSEGNAGCDLIYLRNPSQNEDAVTTLASHLGKGGAVLADNCRAEDPAALAGAVEALTAKLKMKLAPVGPGDPLLDARYPFSEAPAGAAEGDVVSSGRFVYSMRDYGCAWAGACGKDVFPRETIRAALEWGVNLAVLSVHPLAGTK
jgi:hypothetical protein